MRDLGAGRARKGPGSPRGIVRFILVLLLFRAALSLAQDVPAPPSGTLSVSLVPESARVGTVVGISLTYRLPEGARLTEEPEIRGLEGLTILDLKSEPDRIMVQILVDRLETLKSGPISLLYLDKEGKKVALTAEPISVTVLSNVGDKPEEAELRPLQDIMPVRARWLKALPWVGGFLCLFLVVGGLYGWHKRRRRTTEFAVMEDPPHVRAQMDIERLVARGLFEKGQVKAFYFALSEILRRYLEALRHFPAAEFTTEEISRHIRKEDDHILVPLLRQADLVKFADRIPTQARKEEDVRTALAYIHKTNPFEEPERGKGTDREAPPS